MLLYLESLIGKIFKILPLREENSEHLAEYVDSLWVEMSGAYFTFSELQSYAEYISMLNIIGYLAIHTVSLKQCKREVFKTINLCKKVIVGVGGVLDD